MAVPARFKNSTYVQKLEQQKTAAQRRARKAKAAQRSPVMTIGSTLSGAFVGGAVAGAKPSIMGAPTPVAAGLLLIGLGLGIGSATITEMGTGSLSLTAGAFGAALTSKATSGGQSQTEVEADPA
jgi:hypothetical protein